MKLFATFVACVCLAQVCLGAPAGGSSSSESSEFLTDADIAEMRSDLKDIPGVNPTSLDNFVNTLSKFRENATEEETMEGVFELLGQAIQEPCEPKVDLKKLMEKFSSDESKETKDDSSSSEELSEDELKTFDEGLTPLVTPSQKSKAMRILRAFGKGGTESGKNAAMQDLFMSAMTALTKTCPTH